MGTQKKREGRARRKHDRSVVILRRRRLERRSGHRYAREIGAERLVELERAAPEK